MDRFSLYVLFSYFRPRDVTLGNSFFQMSSYACAYVCVTCEKNKRKIPLGTKRTSLRGPFTVLSIFRTATARFLQEQNVATLLSAHDFAFSTCNPRAATWLLTNQERCGLLLSPI